MFVLVLTIIVYMLLIIVISAVREEKVCANKATSHTLAHDETELLKSSANALHLVSEVNKDELQKRVSRRIGAAFSSSFDDLSASMAYISFLLFILYRSGAGSQSIRTLTTALAFRRFST